MENREKNSGFGVASYVLGFSGSISMLVVQYMAIISVIRGNFTDVRLELIGIFALALVIVLFSSLILGIIGACQKNYKKGLPMVGMSISLTGIFMFIISIIWGVYVL